MYSKLESLFKNSGITRKFGFLDSSSQCQLAFMAPQVETGPILEFGAYLGKSTYTLAKYKKDNVIIHTVDKFQSFFDGSEYIPVVPNADLMKYYFSMNPSSIRGEVALLQSFIFETGDNIKAFKYVLKEYLDTIVIHKSDTRDFVLEFSPELAFVDAGHSYEECYTDLEKIIIHSECTIAVHDFDQEDVAKACIEISQKYNRKLTLVGTKMAWIHDVAGSKDEAIKEMLLLSNQF